MARLEVDEIVAVDSDEVVLPWYVAWSAVFVGALAALGLLRYGTWHEFRLITLIFSVFGSFLSFVLGGWAASRIAGFRRTDTAMLHGAIVWLVTIPALLFFAALGSGGYFGTWYSGLAAPPAWAPQATPQIESVAAATAARNAALGTLTALLLGLIGGVVGGWMGSREPMMVSYSNNPYGLSGRALEDTR